MKNLTARNIGVAAAIFACWAGTTYAQTPQVKVEQVHHEETTTVNKNGDTATAQSSSTTRTVTTEGAPAEGTASSDIRASRVIPWSYASSRPDLPDAERPALYVWHEKNTVYVATIGDDSGPHSWSGSVDINNGRFDTLKNISTDGNDRFSQEGQNRIAFKLQTGKGHDTFKFNLRSGDRLRFDVMLDGQRTDRIYFGGAMAQAHGDPVIFDVNR
jgi:hypothetical protein